MSFARVKDLPALQMCSCGSLTYLAPVFEKSSYVLAHIKSRKADFLRCGMSAPAAKVQ